MGLKDLQVRTDPNDLIVKDGIVYILEIDIDGKQIVKIGVTARKIEERVCEILTSFWKSYRVFPRLYPKRFRRTSDIYGKEKALLSYFSDRKYTSEKKFSGCQELVDVPLDEVVKKYEEILNKADDGKEV